MVAEGEEMMTGTNDSALQGWCTDPWGLHEARYFSAGHPTKLVRDGDRESYEEPPATAPTADPVPIESNELGDGSDTKRAEDGLDGQLDYSMAAEVAETEDGGTNQLWRRPS